MCALQTLKILKNVLAVNPMWEERNSEANGIAYSKHNDSVFSELMHECKHNAPGARLSARLRTALERMSPEERQAVVSRTQEGCAPLFVAARRGNVELVEYLVHVCGANLEQRGVFEVAHDRSRHAVTPLWGAAVAGRVRALAALVAAGADLDAASDSGSTPARSACFMTHVDVVRFLAESGADLRRANHNGGTCLINAVQSVPLCELLLARAVPVDAADTQLKTALHYAIQEHRLETVRLLLQHGADPLLQSRAGDDALRTAALRGAAPILALLLARVPYSTARAADAWELLGATQLDEFNDVSSALAAWRRATALRWGGAQYVEKCGGGDALSRRLGTGELAAAALGGAREWRTAAELEALAGDVDALRVQAVLVAARVAGAHHKDTVFRLMFRGASYADSFQYQRCIDLWTWALHIRIEKDTLLHSDTVHTVSALTRLLVEAKRLAAGARHAAAARVCSLLAGALPGARAALVPRPVHRRQADGVDRALRCAAHLLLLQLQTATERQMPALRRRAAALVRADVRSAGGDSLLHLAASRLTVVRSAYFAEGAASTEFPSPALARLLLSVGADPRQRNEARSTPLHVAAVPYNYSAALLHCLLAGGAHLDQPNRFGDSAAELVALHRQSPLRPLQHITLACLAARALVRLPQHHQPDPAALPRTLRDFLELHRP